MILISCFVIIRYIFHGHKRRHALSCSGLLESSMWVAHGDPSSPGANSRPSFQAREGRIHHGAGGSLKCPEWRLPTVVPVAPFAPATDDLLDGRAGSFPRHDLCPSNFAPAAHGWLNAPAPRRPSVSPTIGESGPAIIGWPDSFEARRVLAELAADHKRLVKPASRHMETRT